jgi:hypothetical protein
VDPLRWHDTVNQSIVLTDGRTGKWDEDEDSKLKDAVQTHGDNDWDAIAALIPGRTRKQCFYKWKDVLKQGIDRENGRSSQWTEDEDSKLKDAVKTHGGTNWDAIAALILGRTTSQCRHRWKNALNPSIALTAGRTGKWSEDEDTKLKDAVQTHGGKNWDAIALLVPGRTRIQCRSSRWKNTLNPSIGQAN